MAQPSQLPAGLMRSNLLPPDVVEILTPATLTALAALPVALYFLKRLLLPSISRGEPPVLRPTIPFIGHLISLIREKSGIFDRLYKETPLPICSLPMLNGWIYVINSPSLISVAMRHRHLSFDPFVIEFSRATMGMTPLQVSLFSDPANIEAVTATIHRALTGDNLLRMNVRALADIAETLNAIPAGTPLDIPDAFAWLRSVVSVATTNALFGKHNPFGPEDAASFDDFEKGIGLLALGVAPSYVAPDALAARKYGQEKLRSYFINHHDEEPDVSALIRDRTALSRRLGIPDESICLTEYSMVFTAIANTIPTLAWFLLNVFANSSHASRIRTEAAAVTALETDPTGHRTAVVDISRLEKECPLLFACYRETLRMYSDSMGNRRVIQDTTLKDPASGKEYLLRKGVNVQWAARLTHSLEPVWGADVSEFRPERWVDSGSAEEKRRRGAMIPFGGGKTLCPGRYFAQAENLGLVAALTLGFEVEGATAPETAPAYLGNAVKRPVGDEGPAIRIMRREGWEDVEWKFEC